MTNELRIKKKKCLPTIAIHGSAVGRASDSCQREPGFESCAAVSNRGQIVSLHCSSSLSCMNEYLAIDSGGYLYTK